MCVCVCVCVGGGGVGSDKFRILKTKFKNSSTKTLTSARDFTVVEHLENGRDDAFLNVLKRIPRAVTTSIIEDLKNEVR